MWIGRNKDKSLWLFEDRPVRDGSSWSCSTPKIYGLMLLDFKLFPHLKWEDDPVEVNFNIVEAAYKARCPHCGKPFTYGEDDIKHERSVQPGVLEQEIDYTYCPECNEYIKLVVKTKRIN